MEMAKNGYPIVVGPLADDDGGGWIAYAPDLLGCMSDGETREEAARNIEDAISVWLEDAQESGDEIPEPYSAANIIKHNVY